MKTSAVFSLALLAGSTVALGAPRESFNVVTINGGPLVGTADAGAGNTVVTVPVLGSDGGGAYTARSVRVNGAVSAWLAATYGAESHILVTSPSGAEVVFQPSGLFGNHPANNFAFDQTLSLTTATTAGNWTVEIYEDFDDAGDDTSYGSLTMTLNDSDAVAPAAPTVNIDLGDVSVGASSSDSAITNTAAGQVKWVKAILPACPADGSGFVDMWTSPATGLTTVMTIPVIAVYEGSTGLLVAWDDISGPNNTNAELTFGSTTSRGPTTYPGMTDGELLDGFNGPLAGGTYYIAVFREGATQTTVPDLGYGVVPGYTGSQRKTILHVRTQDNLSPTPPALSLGEATPSPATSGATVTISATVTGGQHPDSTALVVTADLGSLGGTGVTMTPIGGGVYTCTGVIPPGANDFSAPYVVTVHAVDGEARHAADMPVAVSVIGSVNWDETINGAGDTGDLPGAAQSPSGSGALSVIVGNHDANDVDMYRIQVCDSASFEATTRFGPDTPDTQLFLFDAAGVGVAMDDDNPAGATPVSLNGTLSSTLSAVPGISNGVYYIAVARYDQDPTNASAQEIWADTDGGGNYNTVRTPDGAGVTDFAVTGWTATSGGTGAYRLSLKGACYAPPVVPPQCSPADIGAQGGVAGHDNHLDNNDFVVFIDRFFAHDAVADLGSQGGVHGADGAWDNNDFVAFIDFFFNDAGNCNG
jgi:hypothetical protein